MCDNSSQPLSPEKPEKRDDGQVWMEVQWPAVGICLSRETRDLIEGHHWVGQRLLWLSKSLGILASSHSADIVQPSESSLGQESEHAGDPCTPAYLCVR
ncbi:hypothetical protein LSAT2_005828 [Lamellibrachia satsuma]|nr:hypothetical protein LSAT2_005828 [Lamellibrachia satsuma]